MKRFSLPAAAAVCVLVGVAPAAAGAKVVELGVNEQVNHGVTKDVNPLTTPQPCTSSGKVGTSSATTKCPKGTNAQTYAIELTTITALQAVSYGKTYPTMVSHGGRIVAFTVALSSIDTNATQRKYWIHLANSNYGGPPRVQVTILRRVGSTGNKWKVAEYKVGKSTVADESPAFHVTPYLGRVVQFALPQSLPVNRGDVVALTTSTWAPVLTVFQPTNQYSYRQSRTDNCKNAPLFNEAQEQGGQTATYGCSYSGTRVEYSATEVLNPSPPPTTSPS
jgi:hypothetical protein